MTTAPQSLLDALNEMVDGNSADSTLKPDWKYDKVGITPEYITEAKKTTQGKRKLNEMHDQNEALLASAKKAKGLCGKDCYLLVHI